MQRLRDKVNGPSSRDLHQLTPILGESGLQSMARASVKAEYSAKRCITSSLRLSDIQARELLRRLRNGIRIDSIMGWILHGTSTKPSLISWSRKQNFLHRLICHGMSSSMHKESFHLPTLYRIRQSKGSRSVFSHFSLLFSAADSSGRGFLPRRSDSSVKMQL